MNLLPVVRSLNANSCKRSIIHTLKVQRCGYSTPNIEEKTHPYAQTAVPEEEIMLTPEEIEKKCNKSRLSEDHYNIMNGGAPKINPKNPEHATLAFHRSMYGLYGASSGINPAICFSTKEEMEEFQEYEKVLLDDHILELRKRALQKLEEERMQVRLREEKIAEALEKVDAWKKRIREKIEAKLAEAEANKQKRERLLEDVRRHFGYTIDFKDERFQLMLEEKEKEEKKKLKELRKKRKEEHFMQKLAQLEADAKPAEEKNNKEKDSNKEEEDDDDDGENKDDEKDKN